MLWERCPDFTADQIRAIEQCEAVAVTVDGTECVIVRRDVYERARRVVEYDDREWGPEERRAVLRSFGEKAGWDDPQLDVYEQYRGRP